jgi:hypothetical protein
MNIPSAPSIQDLLNGNQLSNQPILSKFELLVKQRELNPYIAEQLKNVLSTCEIVLLCDDSESMSLNIAEEGTDPFAPRNSTRWLELKKLAAVIIQFVTSVNDNGLDLYFLNRQKICNVNSLSGLQNIFNLPPQGSTNISNALLEIYEDKKYVLGHKKLLIVVVTDGEPTDNTKNPRTTLFNTIQYIVSDGSNNVHISFAECTDNSEDMQYLDDWDGLLQNFDNTDDYREELIKIKAIQGMQFKFDYTDYVIKILLATFIRWYYNLDQVKVNQNNNYQQYPQNSQIFQPQSNYIPATKIPQIQSQIQPQIQSQIQPQIQPQIQSQMQPYNTQYQNDYNKKQNDTFCCNIL